MRHETCVAPSVLGMVRHGVCMSCAWVVHGEVRTRADEQVLNVKWRKMEENVLVQVSQSWHEEAHGGHMRGTWKHMGGTGEVHGSTWVHMRGTWKHMGGIQEVHGSTKGAYERYMQVTQHGLGVVLRL